MPPDAVSVLIATPLEPELVARIERVDERVRVLYEPALIPAPRYAADHTGVPPALTADGLEQWSRLRLEADVSFDFDWLDPAGMPANCPQLRWVQGTSAGIGGFLERTGLAESDLVFTTAAGVHGAPLAEFALLGLLYFAKGLPQLAAWQAERHWERHTTAQLAGRRAVVVGLGGIGRSVARQLSLAGLQVCGAGRAGHSYEVPGVTCYISSDRLDEVLPDADALVLACPLTEETRGLIGPRQLRLLPPGAVIVNISRGPIIDQDALIEELSRGHLGGAFLDVFAVEPLPASSPLWALPNVVISPHSAATVAAENELITDLFCDNLRRWLDGLQLRNVYDRAAGY